MAPNTSLDEVAFGEALIIAIWRHPVLIGGPVVLSGAYMAILTHPFIGGGTAVLVWIVLTAVLVGVAAVRRRVSG